MHIVQITRLSATVAGCAILLGTTNVAQAQLPSVRLTAGMHVIHAEVAATYGSRMQGLMYRKTLGQSEGMLFIFDEDAAHCMWMKNTFVPLSVAFLDERGAIINVADMQPESEKSHCAARPARYALEMNRGWFAQRGLRPGMAIRGVPGVAQPR